MSKPDKLKASMTCPVCSGYTVTVKGYSRVKIDSTLARKMRRHFRSRKHWRNLTKGRK